MRSDLLAFLNFSHKGMVVLYAVTSGAVVIALLVNLIPMRAGLRAMVLVLGSVAAIVFISTRPYGEDRAAWAIVFGFGVLAWLLAFAITGIVRATRRSRTRFANPS